MPTVRLLPTVNISVCCKYFSHAPFVYYSVTSTGLAKAAKKQSTVSGDSKLSAKPSPVSSSANASTPKKPVVNPYATPKSEKKGSLFDDLLQPTVATPSSLKKGRINSCLRAAICSHYDPPGIHSPFGGTYSAFGVLVQPEDGSNMSQYAEYLLYQHIDKFPGLVDFGRPLRLSIDGVPVKNNKGYDCRWYFGQLKSNPHPSKVKLLLQNYADILNELTGNNPHVMVPDDWQLPHTTFSEFNNGDTLAFVIDALWGKPSENENYWTEHGYKIPAFFPLPWAPSMAEHFKAPASIDVEQNAEAGEAGNESDNADDGNDGSVAEQDLDENSDVEMEDDEKSSNSFIVEGSGDDDDDDLDEELDEDDEDF